MEKIERRAAVSAIELRAKDDARPTIEGYAIVFESLSEDLGGFREIVARDATIEMDDVRALWNHDRNYVIGRESSGTLSIQRDDRGIKVSIDPPDAQWCDDLISSIRRKDVREQSFGFKVLPNGDSWQETSSGLVRTLRGISLKEVSIVSFPAYAETDASLRSAGEVLADRPRGPITTEAHAIYAMRARALNDLTRGFLDSQRRS